MAVIISTTEALVLGFSTFEFVSELGLTFAGQEFVVRFEFFVSFDALSAIRVAAVVNLLGNYVSKNGLTIFITVTILITVIIAVVIVLIFS